MNSIEISEIFNCSPELIYNMFMDSGLHSEITGAEATVENKVNGKFSAWDNYIEGKTTELDVNRKIIQHWRTRDFSDTDSDSILEIYIEDLKNGKSKLTLKHENLPENSGEVYKKGWQDFYFDPLKKYLEK